MAKGLVIAGRAQTYNGKAVTVAGGATCCCGGGGGVYRYYVLKPCDACPGLNETWYADEGIWNCPIADGRDCLYFGRGLSCHYLHRTDPLVVTDYPPPREPLVCADVLVDMFSCCQCCDDECNSTFHGGDGTWHGTLGSIINAYDDYGILAPMPPQCCCPDQPADFYGTTFTIHRWDQREYIRRFASQTKPEMERRLQARGEFTVGDTPDFVWARYDDYLYGDHFECDRAEAKNPGEGQCQVYPHVVMDYWNCPDIPFSVVMDAPLRMPPSPPQPPAFVEINRFLLAHSCESLRLMTKYTVHSLFGGDIVPTAIYEEYLYMTWILPTLVDPCYEPCAPTVDKVPRPGGPGTPISPIGVRPAL